MDARARYAVADIESEKGRYREAEKRISGTGYPIPDILVSASGKKTIMNRISDNECQILDS